MISYARVSTGAQAASGLGIEAQRRAVQAAAAERGWLIVKECTDDAVSGSIDPRLLPRMPAALSLLDAGEADVLAAVRLDRFARLTRDLQLLTDLAARGGWELIGLDVPISDDEPVGAFLRNILGATNELDRALISGRTKSALAVTRSRGQRLGRPSRQPQAAKELAVAMYADGSSLRQIAAALEDLGLRTATDKTAWPHSSVQGLLRTAQLDQEAQTNTAHHAAQQQEP